MAVLQNKWTEQAKQKKQEPKRKEKRPTLGVSGNMHKTLRGVRK